MNLVPMRFKGVEWHHNPREISFSCEQNVSELLSPFGISYIQNTGRRETMNAREIYDILRAGGLSRAGALGMLGNMWAESGLKENIAQRGMTPLTDDDYTKAADAGAIRFATDSVGYGLCQWTHHSRKEALLRRAKSQGVSVGNGKMQVEFCVIELQSEFPELFKYLCSSTDIDACSDRICNTYERPAVNNYAARQNAAHRFEQEIPVFTPAVKDPVNATFPPDPSVWTIQLVMSANGYWHKPDGRKSDEFFKALAVFCEDMKKC